MCRKVEGKRKFFDNIEKYVIYKSILYPYVKLGVLPKSNPIYRLHCHYISKFLLVILAYYKRLKKVIRNYYSFCLKIINMANEKKVATPTKVDLGAKFNLLASRGIISASRKESIYCLEIFSGKSEKERKAMRKKLRNNRDNFVSEMLSAKEENRKSLAQTWKEYATGIYKDIFTVYESNTSTDKLSDLAEFTKILRKELTTK